MQATGTTSAGVSNRRWDAIVLTRPRETADGEGEIPNWRRDCKTQYR